MAKKNETLNEEAETIIGAGVEVEGTFVSSGNVTVKGQVSGSLETKSDLYVAETAKIEAEVKAKNAFIGGEIKGNITVEERVKLANTAKVFGDITCQALSIEEGAVLNGKCQMTGQKVEAQEAEEE